MAGTKPRTVDEFIAGMAPEIGAMAEGTRAAIRAAVPDAGETISYAIAAFTLDGKPFLYLSGATRHVALYPVTDELLAVVPGVSAHVTGKATMRFDAGEKLPTALIRRVAKAKAAEHRAARAARAGAASKKVAPGAKKATNRPVSRAAAQSSKKEATVTKARAR